MLRMITALTALAFIALTAACTDTAPLTGSRGYCDVNNGASCTGVEGSGDCQPCPDTPRTARTLR